MLTSSERPTTVVVVAGGDPIDPGCALVPSDAPVVAADSGADPALALGLRVDELIEAPRLGGATSIDAVTAAGGTVERHPAAKDYTDPSCRCSTRGRPRS